MTVSKLNSRGQSTSKKAQATPLDSELVRKRLDELRPVLANAVVGDFSKDLKIPEHEDEFTELFVGVQMMQEVIREQIQELKDLNQSLEAKAIDRTRALEEAQALTHLGSWEWDIATNVISWSDELYRIYGLKPQVRAIGYEEFITMIHEDDRQRIQDAITVSFQTAQPFSFEHRIILPNGKERILKGMGKTVSDEAGHPIRMLGTSQDITVAKQLDRAKDEFMSLVSHQLRTPLTIIRIHGNLLEDGIAGPLEPEQKPHIQTMTSASIRLIKLVDDILNISRIALNRIRIEAVPTDANQLIQTCVDEALPLAEEKGIAFNFTPDPSIGSIPLDATIFGEVIRNLTSNALRYTNETDGKVDISFAKDKNGYLLTVSDNGIGIPKLEQEYVFERFYRANNATVVDSDGSGLGLYIVKLFTEAAGGKIWFESAEGKGTTFYVLLPPQGMRSRQVKKSK